MSLDSKQKRGSVIGLTLPWRRWQSEPTGSDLETATERQSVLHMSAAISAGAAVAVDETPVGGGLRPPKLLETAVIAKAKARKRKIRKVKKKIAAVERKVAKAKKVAPAPKPKSQNGQTEKVFEFEMPIPPVAPVAFVPEPLPEPEPIPVISPDILDMTRQLQGLYEQMAMMQQQAAIDRENEAIEILLLVA